MTGRIRPPTAEDAATVARLMSHDAPEPVDEARVLLERSFPGVELEKDARVADGSYAFVDPELGWVRLLGVRHSNRGQGVGRALLLRAFAQFRDRGMKRVGLGVDGESPTGANALYESAGMRVVSRFAIHEKSAA